MEFHFIEGPKLRELHRWPVTGLERILYYPGSMGGEEEMRQLERIFSIDRNEGRQEEHRIIMERLIAGGSALSHGLWRPKEKTSFSRQNWN
jgi:hypothetical protein